MEPDLDEQLIEVRKNSSLNHQNVYYRGQPIGYIWRYRGLWRSGHLGFQGEGHTNPEQAAFDEYKAKIPLIATIRTSDP